MLVALVNKGIYGESEWASAPSLARNLSRGCGNPVGFANLQAGKVVVDHGCAGGINVIPATRRVGMHGKVIGVDMTPHMIDRAREADAQAGIPSSSAEFRLASLESTTLPDACADEVISNCVVNLCPDKDAVYRQAFRILKPGGRLAVSDIMPTEPISAGLREPFVSIWAGCAGGAIPEEDYRRTLRDAGFVESAS